MSDKLPLIKGISPTDRMLVRLVDYYTTYTNGVVTHAHNIQRPTARDNDSELRQAQRQDEVSTATSGDENDDRLSRVGDV